MEEWIKVYEEMIDDEIIKDIENYDFWFNEILKDEQIPFKNKIDLRNEKEILGFGDYNKYLEVYVPNSFEERVKIIISQHMKTEMDDSELVYLSENESENLNDFCEDADYDMYDFENEGYINLCRDLFYPDNYSYAGIPEEFFNNTFMYEITKPNEYSSTDRIVGELEGSKFIMGNLYLKYYDWINDTGESFDLTAIFDGVFMKLQIPNYIKSRIYIEAVREHEDLYDEKFNDKDNLNSSNDIKNEFKRQYNVYELDEYVSNEILDENFMEEILNLQKKYNKEFRFYFAANIVNVMVNDVSLTDRERIEKRLDSEDTLLETFYMMQEVARVVKTFKLNQE